MEVGSYFLIMCLYHFLRIVGFALAGWFVEKHRPVYYQKIEYGRCVSRMDVLRTKTV